MAMPPQLSEHRKLRAIEDRFDTIYEFVMWLHRNGYTIQGDRGRVDFDRTFLLKYFEINEDLLMKEIQQAVAYVLDS
jgi:hypothetical protein